MPRICLLLSAAALVLLAACGGGEARPEPTPAGTPVAASLVIPKGSAITIGVSAALSGDQVNLGTDIADAAELAVGDAGGKLLGREVRVRRVDDGCTDAEKAVDVARSLVEDETLVAVIGPMCTTGAQAANPLYERAGIVHISPSATRNDLSEQGERYFFRTAWRDEVQAATQSSYALDTLSLQSALVVDDGTPYGRTLADAFVAAYEGQAGRIVSRERIERGTRDFSGLARQIKSVAPDVVVYEGLDPEGALLVKALREADYIGAFIGPDGLLSVRDFLQNAGPAAENAVLTGGATPDEAFVARFTERFQRAPGTPFVLQSHDAVSALLMALRSVATERDDGAIEIDRARLAEALRAQTFDGLTGAISFDERGDRRGETARALGLRVYRVTEGRFLAVE